MKNEETATAQPCKAKPDLKVLLARQHYFAGKRKHNCINKRLTLDYETCLAEFFMKLIVK